MASKEGVYHEKINPLMAQIVDICKEHKIPMIATFCLDAEERVQCTTALVEDEWDAPYWLLAAFREAYDGQ